MNVLESLGCIAGCLFVFIRILSSLERPFKQFKLSIQMRPLRPYKTLKQRLELLAELGFKLNESISVDEFKEVFYTESFKDNDLLRFLKWKSKSILTDHPDIDDLLRYLDRPDTALESWWIILFALGMSQDNDHKKPFCNNLMFFDLEFLWETSSFKSAMARLEEVTEGRMPLSNLRILHHSVMEPPSYGEYLLKFRGTEYQIESSLVLDIYSCDLIDQLAILNNDNAGSKVLALYPYDEFDYLIAYVTPQQLAKLKSLGFGFYDPNSNDTHYVDHVPKPVSSAQDMQANHPPED